MSEESALQPVEQKEVEFYEDRITAALAQEGDESEIYVSINQICDLLGIDRRGQQRRITEDAVLSSHTRQIIIQTAGGPQTMLCLPIDYMHGWLMSINANRVKKEIRERLIRYQENCHRVLAEAFQEGRLTADQDFETLLQQADPDAVQAYQIAQAVVRLARNQIMMETRLTGRIDAHERRLEEIEATLGDPGRAITPSQASQISQAVKAVAHEMGKRSGRNEYQGVYGELYRRFEITSYKLLPAHRFEEAMQWLTEWYLSITGGNEVPF